MKKIKKQQLEDMKKLLTMSNEILAHKLDINHDSARKLKTAIEELAYVLRDDLCKK
jgi:hypothetical protein